MGVAVMRRDCNYQLDTTSLGRKRVKNVIKKKICWKPRLTEMDTVKYLKLYKAERAQEELPFTLSKA
jgi:hypothetical protein